MIRAGEQQLTLPGEWAAAEGLVARMDQRLRALRLVGLTLWTCALGQVLARLQARQRERDGELYEQLMLLEDELANGAPAAAVRERIGTIKGLLTLCAIAGLLWAICWPGDDVSARPLRAARRGRREAMEFCVEG